MSEYANGADGTCQECGEGTEQEWHAYCGDCFAEQNGWRQPNRDALEVQHQERERVSTLALVDRVDRLERQVIELVELLASLAARLERLEMPDRRAA